MNPHQPDPVSDIFKDAQRTNPELSVLINYLENNKSPTNKGNLTKFDQVKWITALHQRITRKQHHYS